MEEEEKHQQQQQQQGHEKGTKVRSLIEMATNSTAPDVDPLLLKAIKTVVRYSDSELRLASQTLMDLMKRDHSQKMETSGVHSSILSLTMMEEDERHHNQFSSISKLHNKAPITTSVHDLLECPVCTNSMYPPIHQCLNGHTLCSNCKTRVHNRCPTCRQELGDIRCLALEKIAESLEFPCRYISLGCSEIFPYYNKLKHESICTFRPYNCPYAGSDCSFVGNIPYLVAHLRDDHGVDMHSGCTFNHRYVKSNPMEVENATWMLTVFHCFGQYFCLHFEAFQLEMSPVYMAFLRFMGDDREAKNYSYSLEVGGNGRKLTFEGSPRSIRDSHKKIKDSHDGLIIYRNMALFFSGGDRKELKLRVSGRIWKEQQNSEGVVCTPNMCS